MNGLSLFACSGIGELLLHKNNIDIKVANELHEDRCTFYKFNHPTTEIICGDICDSKIKANIIEQCKLHDIQYLQATPPCQGFSTAGAMDENDPRNFLTIHVVDIIHKIQPKYILIENVPNFAKKLISINKKPMNIIDYLKSELSSMYDIEHAILNVADYGVAQTRKRIFVIMNKKDSEKKLKFPVDKSKHITVRQAIGHLPSLESGEKSQIPLHYAPTHNEKHILWMKHTPTGKSAFDNKIHYPQKDGRMIKGFKNTYKRIEWDKPAPTITMANGVISSQENVHPGRLHKDGTYSDARVLSIHELMILTGIETLWKIPPNTKDSLVRHMLGECVPPCIIYEITKSIS